MRSNLGCSNSFEGTTLATRRLFGAGKPPTLNLSPCLVQVLVSTYALHSNESVHDRVSIQENRHLVSHKMFLSL
jgi:hypothetical protein